MYSRKTKKVIKNPNIAINADAEKRPYALLLFVPLECIAKGNLQWERMSLS